MRCLFSTAVLAWLVVHPALCEDTTLSSPSDDCKCFPGDACWPSLDAWKDLNETVGGRLIATVPIRSPYHDPIYNATECEYLQGQVLNPQFQ